MSDDKLKILGQTASDVPAAAATLVDDLSAAHAGFVNAFPSELFLDDLLTIKLTEIAGEIESHADQVQEDQGDLSTLLEELQEVSEQLTGTVDSESKRLALAIEHLSTEVQEIGDGLLQEKERIDASLSTLLKSAEEFEEVNDLRLGQFEQSFQSVDEKLKQHKGSIDQLETSVDSEIDTAEQEFRDEIEGLREVTDAKVSELANTLAEQEAALVKSQDSLGTVLETLLTTEKEFIADQLRSTIDEASSVAMKGISSLDAEIQESAKKTSTYREMAEPAIDRIHDQTNQLKNHVQRASEAVRNFAADITP